MIGPAISAAGFLDDLLAAQADTDLTTSPPHSKGKSQRKTPHKAGTNQTTKTTESKFDWTDDMIRSMLRLRFTDPTIVSRFLAADTNNKKDTFWCYFAAVLTSEVGIGVSAKRLRDKYKKVKHEYKAHCDDIGRTGNGGIKTKPPRYLHILQWFSGRTGVANESMFDSNDYDETQKEIGDDSDDEGTPIKRIKLENEPKAKAGVNLLTQEMGRGMQAITDAFRNTQPNNDITMLLRTSQEENRNVMERVVQMQERQNALMEQLMNALAHRN
ncbi:hypothetical protein AC1031_019599 [Aphanomyces cochlioides]|nr:hypothetical protein AC1031_019599 [Aphanomyces cochlioides]